MVLGREVNAAVCVCLQRKGSSTMVIKLAQAKIPDALGMEMKEIKIASARAAAGHHTHALPCDRLQGQATKPRSSPACGQGWETHGPSKVCKPPSMSMANSSTVTLAGTEDGAKYYVLRSYLPSAVRKDFLQRRAPDAVPTQAFELTVLALIVMNGDRISDGVAAVCSAKPVSCGCAVTKCSVAANEHSLRRVARQACAAAPRSVQGTRARPCRGFVAAAGGRGHPERPDGQAAPRLRQAGGPHQGHGPEEVRLITRAPVEWAGYIVSCQQHIWSSCSWHP